MQDEGRREEGKGRQLNINKACCNRKKRTEQMNGQVGLAIVSQPNGF
jgi:hypothetical protein